MAGKSRQEWVDSIRTLIDEREAFCMSSITKAPNEEYGLVLVCLKGDLLNVYDTNVRGEPGPQLYSIDLRKVTRLKFSGSRLFPYYRFQYLGANFAFTAGLASSPALQEAFRHYQRTE